MDSLFIVVTNVHLVIDCFYAFSILDVLVFPYLANSDNEDFAA
jgi:hypothetical protein